MITRPRPFLARTLLLLLALLLPRLVSAAPQNAASFTTETDPDFVLRMPFRVLKAGGSSELVFKVDGQRSVQLQITPTALALVEISSGKKKQLARSAAQFAATNTLFVTRRGSLFRVALNDRVLLETKAAPGEVAEVTLNNTGGRIQLLGEPRLQPTEEIYLTDDFMTTPDAPSRWQGVTGTWHVAGAGRPQDAADPFKFVGFAPGEAVALNADSRWFWNDYQVEVSARADSEASALGVVFGYRSPQDFYCFSWSGTGGVGPGKMSLWRRKGKQTFVISERTARLQPGQWHRLSVSTFGTEVAAYIDANLALKGAAPNLVGGQIGLYGSGEVGAEFDDVMAQSAISTSLIASRTRGSDSAWQERSFASDPFMAAWGDESAEWEKSAHDKTAHWYRGHFFGAVDVRIAADLLALTASSSLQEIWLLGEDGQPNAGYRVLLEPKKASLLKEQKVLASTQLSPGSAIEIRIRNGTIEIFGESGKLLSYVDRAPTKSGRIGLRFGADVAAQAVAAQTVAAGVQVKSPNLVEYRFDAAPVDWKIESGVWQSTTRWACVPNWNFFGGKGLPPGSTPALGSGSPLATVWNKRGFGGDQWIEAFIAPSEGTSDFMHFAYPVNLNLTFGATDEQLGSGYNLIYRVHDQSTLLYRNGKVVAESKAMVLPDWRADAMFVYHRLTETWQHLQILREGGRIRIWSEVPGPAGKNVPRQLLIDYTDPEPLSGDRMALWTWGINGMSVAKLRVSSGEVRAPYVDFLRVAGAPSVPAKTPLQRHVNPINGGAFRIDLIKQSTPVEALPVLQFDFKNSPDVALALYAVLDNQLFRANFLGVVRDDGDAVSIGTFRQTGRDVKRAGFNLLQALRAVFPSGKLPVIEQLFLANLSTAPDQIGGLSTNPKDATFELGPFHFLDQKLEVTDLPDNMLKDPFASIELAPAAKAQELPGVIRIAVQSIVLDPAACVVTVNGQVLKWGEPGLAWDPALRRILVDVAAAGLHFKDGEKVEVSVSLPQRGAAPLFSRTRTMKVAADQTPPSAPRVSTSAGPDRIENFETGTGGWQRLGGEQGATLWRDTSTAASGKASLRLYHREVAGSFGAVVRDQPFDARRWPLATFSYRLKPEVQLSLLCEIGGRWFEIDFTDTDHTYPVVGAIGGVQKDGEWHSAEVDLLAAVQKANAGSTVISRLFFADSGITNNLQDIFWNVDDFRYVPALPVGNPSTLRWSAQDAGGIAGYNWVLDNSPTTVPGEMIRAGAPETSANTGATYLHVRAVDKAGNWGATSHFRFATLPAADATTPAVEVENPPTNAALSAPVIELKLKGAQQIDIESLRYRVRQNGAWTEYSAKEESSEYAALLFDADEGVLRWQDPELIDKQAAAEPFTLDVELHAADLAGRAVLKERWKFSIDPALDKTAPPAPYLAYIPTNRLMRFDFENAIPSDFAIRRSSWILSEGATAATGKGSARIVNLAANDFFSAFLKKSPYSVDRYPQIQFDYRFETPHETMRGRWRRRRNSEQSSQARPQRTPYNLNLVGIVNGEMQIVKFIGGPDASRTFRENNIGEIANVRADEQWHRASFDLKAMLRKRYPATPRFFADYIGTWSTGPRGYDNPQGASLWLDNVTFFSTAASSATFEWKPPHDSNGIVGYSYLLDQISDTVPAAKTTTTSMRADFKDLKPGTWYFHVRAVDGAGNWSEPSHLTIELTAP